MASKIFTSTFDIIKTVQFYNDALNNQQLNLSYFRQIAQNRWPWIVQNWSDLSKRFQTAANGDQEQETALEDLGREVQSYKLGNQINPFNDGDKLIKFDVFLEQIPIASLKLTPDEITNFNVEVDNISQLDTDSFKSALVFLRKEQAIFSQTIGLSDPVAAKFLGITETAKKREATIQDLESLDERDNLYKIIQGIVYNLQLTEKRPPDILAMNTAMLTPQSGVTIEDIYLSYVPYPFEISLEDMARKYLGSKDRWYELATINNLKPPYIDQSGIKVSLIAPAALNNVIIPDDQKDQLYVGGKIGIGSFKYREESRIIEKIILIENGTMILFLSGQQDLSKYQSSQGAYIRVYKPQTTRPGQFIMVPLTKTGFNAQSSKTPDSDTLRRLSEVFQNFGVDIAVDETTGDWQVDSNGNFKYAFGLKAVRKAVLNALKTTRGELDFHPTYGVSLSIGDRYYGTISEAALFGELIRTTLLQDQRFSNVLISKISSTGTSISIGLLVTLEGGGEAIPLSFIS